MTPLPARAIACPACSPACTRGCTTGRLTGCPACLDRGWVHLPGELWAWPGSADRVLAMIAAHAAAGLTLPGARLTVDGRLEYGGYTGIRVIDLPAGDQRRPRPSTVVALTPPPDSRTHLFDPDDPAPATPTPRRHRVGVPTRPEPPNPSRPPDACGRWPALTLRMHGTRTECAHAARLLRRTPGLVVLAQRGPYRDRGRRQLVRVYLHVRLIPEPTR
jgi:hypothetical protein